MRIKRRPVLAAAAVFGALCFLPGMLIGVRCGGPGAAALPARSAGGIAADADGLATLIQQLERHASRLDHRAEAQEAGVREARIAAALLAGRGYAAGSPESKAQAELSSRRETELRRTRESSAWARRLERQLRRGGEGQRQAALAETARFVESVEGEAAER